MDIKSGLTIVSSLLISNLAFALPQNGQVVGGSATISQSGTQTTINQASQNTVINWGGFDTASNESVKFTQPNASSIALNRINSGVPTTFAGSLNANGRVFIVNSSGILFTSTSKVDVAGLVATTADINDNDFMNNNYNFSKPGKDNASVVNNGTITTGDAGVVALIAPNVSNGNSGIIQANIGTVVLSSGKTFVLDFNQDGLINFDSSSVVKNAHVENAGNIQAINGKIYMTANTVSEVLDNVICLSGVTQADTLYTDNGKIVLDAGAGRASFSGNVTASSVQVSADSGITISGYFGGSDVTQLIANNGFITETPDGEMVTAILWLSSSTGTTLASQQNSIGIQFGS